MTETITYKVIGMSCGHCVRNVQNTLKEMEGIDSVRVSLEPAEAIIEMTKPISLERLNAALKEVGMYHLEASGL